MPGTFFRKIFVSIFFVLTPKVEMLIPLYGRRRLFWECTFPIHTYVGVCYNHTNHRGHLHVIYGMCIIMHPLNAPLSERTSTFPKHIGYCTVHTTHWKSNMSLHIYVWVHCLVGAYLVSLYNSVVTTMQKTHYI